MDPTLYYQKVRAQESQIAEAYPVVMSLETPDGGKPGTASEVTRANAARLIADGMARLATTEESATFRAAQMEASREAEQRAAANKLQLSVMTSAELDLLKDAVRGAKEKA